MKTTDFAHHLTDFLGRYVSATRNLSPNTIKSYRDTFMLLLGFYRDYRGVRLEQLTLDALNTERVTEFLEHLQAERGCSISTRNQRMAAIHAFVRYLQVECPERILQCQQILAVPRKRSTQSEVSYLTREEIAAVLAQPDLETSSGRRDAVMLSLLYDTGARVQEIIDLRVRDLRLDTTPAQVRVTGKGRKVRTVPLLTQTTRLVAEYLQEHDLRRTDASSHPVFFNRSRQQLSRSGVRYILDKYVVRALKANLCLHERVTPHMLRHSKAMHLYQAGNPLSVISRLFGHVSVTTTEIYARADMAMKEQALAKLTGITPAAESRSWQQDPSLMDWLRNL